MERIGAELVVRRAVVRDVHKPRVAGPPPGELTTRWQDLIDDPGVEVVVELMGGIDEPLALINAAIDAGKVVVTGNKALLAEHGREIFARAAEKEGARVLRGFDRRGHPDHQDDPRGAHRQPHRQHPRHHQRHEQLHPHPHDRRRVWSFAEALAEAQAHGYAEADPTLDINGWDAAHKAIILASLAYGFWVETDRIFVEGIDRLTATDIRFAGELGYRVKLLAIIKADGGPENGGGVEVRVHPTLIPKTHVLASVSGVFNAVAVRGDVVGETLILRARRGAGPDGQRGHQRPRGSRRCPGRPAPHLRLHPARPLRNLSAAGGDRFAVLPAAGGGRPTRGARAGGGHLGHARDRDFVGGPARDARRSRDARSWCSCSTGRATGRWGRPRRKSCAWHA